MFKLIKIVGGRINVFEPELHIANAAVKNGEALVLNSDGKLVVCGQEVRPTFIALADGAANEEIAVGRVESNQIFETAAVSGVKVGGKYKLATDGLGIVGTAASTNGAEVVAIGDTVLVRF